MLGARAVVVGRLLSALPGVAGACVGGGSNASAGKAGLVAGRTLLVGSSGRLAFLAGGQVAHAKWLAARSAPAMVLAMSSLAEAAAAAAAKSGSSASAGEETSKVEGAGKSTPVRGGEDVEAESGTFKKRAKKDAKQAERPWVPEVEKEFLDRAKEVLAGPTFFSSAQVQRVRVQEVCGNLPTPCSDP